MIWLLLILITPDESNQIGIVGNPLAHYRSFDGNTNISSPFEFGIPAGQENQCNLIIEEQNQTRSLINDLGFDSCTTGIMDTTTTKTMIWLLLILVTPEESNQVGIVGNPLAHYRSCGDDTNIYNTFKFGIATGKVNEYDLIIEEQNQTRSLINHLRFDSYSTGIMEVFDRQDHCRWGFDRQDTISSTLEQITNPMMSALTFWNSCLLFAHTKLNTENFCTDTENSVCRGDSGSGQLMVSGWGVADTRKVLPTRKCHWPAFWLVVCPWYGMHHCQSKIL